jgi:hypothetical protein
MDKRVLITLQDLKKIRPLASLDGSRWEQYAVESQDQELRPILGDGLYYDFMTKVFNSGAAEYADYQLLLNGTNWTYNGQSVYFDGLVPMLGYFTLARFIQNNPVNITRYGIVTKTLPQSTPVDQTMISAVVNELRSSAITYKNQVDNYLLNNVDTYPLYIGGESTIETGFKFFIS